MKKWTKFLDIELFSIQGFEPNPDKSSLEVILSFKGIRKEFFQSYNITTNNRIELMGAIFGHEQIKTKTSVPVFTDSKYLISKTPKCRAVKRGKNGLKRMKNSSIINSDLCNSL